MAQPATTSTSVVPYIGYSTEPPPPPAPPAPPAPPTCVICTEEFTAENPRLKPCRTCQADYCQKCVARMFIDVVDDPTLFPPKCCSFLQIHTGLAELSDQEADKYRQKLDEYLTVDKTYCPSKTCSTFIQDRLLPPAPTEAQAQPTTLQSVLEEVVKKSVKHPTSRFIRKRPKMDESNGLTDVDHELGLYDVEERVKANVYTSAEQLAADVSVIVANSKARFPRAPGKPEHPIYKTADDFSNYYAEELSAAIDKLADAQRLPTAPSHLFTCPKCHIGICTKCKQIEHGTTTCDTSAADQELAMLEQFGYKRCPLCKHAVKKMFGCSHMQCRCGAHWCYSCQKSIDDCAGGCGGADSDEDDFDDEDHDVDSEGDADAEEVDGDDVEVNRPAELRLPLDETSVANQVSQTADAVGKGTTASTTDQPNTQDAPLSQAPAIRNLDGGGGRRWADSMLDFGEEPEDEGYNQIWSCRHTFLPYAASDDGHNHGDLKKMECNRCFSRVEPAKPNGSRLAKKRKRARSIDNTVGWECLHCRILVCLGCRRKNYKNADLKD